MLAGMKPAHLCPFLLIAACSSGPSKEESLKIFLATDGAMASAQANAVAASRHAALAPDSLTVNYSGNCLVGGTVAVAGNYEGSRTDDRAQFDLTMSFVNCRDLTGQLDGSLTWSSTASGSMFNASMTGGISYKDPNTDASCDYDLHLAVAPALVSYSGTMCGYDVQTELKIGPRN
jgi:hypothetical protein